MSTVDVVIETARAEVGYTEEKRKGVWTNNTKYADQVAGLQWADFQPWCAVFVAWVAQRAGVAALYPRTASCDTAGSWFKGRKRWSEYPAVGAQVFYGSPHDLNHTGIVVGYDDDQITTVEGNTNDSGAREGTSVLLKTRERRSARVVGYGYPEFPEGIRSADPRYAGDVERRPADPQGGPAPLRVDGVDLSHWQDGPLDFARAQAAGVRFVVHKVTEGTGMEDPCHEPRRGPVGQAGLVWGGYHFARPEASSGAKQAQFLLSRLRPRSGDLRPVLDLEKTGDLPPDRLGAWAADFAAEISARVGVDPIVYTPFDLPERLGPLWVARYSDDNRAPRVPRPWDQHDVWQFSDGTFGTPRSVPGLGRCDLDTLADPDGLGRLLIP